MRSAMWIFVVVLAGSTFRVAAGLPAEIASGAQARRVRRQHAAAAFHDGVLLVHARSDIDYAADGFRQDPHFYYFTGLENTVGGLLAIDGKSGEGWLFLLPHGPSSKLGLKPEIQPGPEAANRLGIEHVVDWAELESFLARQAGLSAHLYFVDDPTRLEELPLNLLDRKAPFAPLWLQVILQKWPAFEAQDAAERVHTLMAVQDAAEIAALRSVGKATVAAITAGMRAIRPEVSQRSVEVAVQNACWGAGAHGGAFWPWAMSGENGVFPRPFASMSRYDHLDQKMKSGDLVRLDVGCEWDHYQGDLGRTVPVSGHYRDDQRETWNIFVAAYRAGVAALRERATIDQVFDAWKGELLRHRESAKSAMAKRAIDAWSDRKNIPYWEIHTTNLLPALPPEPLRAGTTINFEPIASVDGQGFFLEDMFLIKKDGAELLTPGVPYSADEIEAAMQ